MLIAAGARGGRRDGRALPAAARVVGGRRLLLRGLDEQRSLGAHLEGREDYGRYGNPTVQSVEGKVAALEHADDAVLFSSGMAAMTTLLLASLPAGAHLVMTDDCYRRTRQFCLVFLKRLGIETTVVPMGDDAALEAAIQPRKTRFVISEIPTNPYLRCVDLEKLAAIARRHRVQTIIDSTFGTPVNQRPLEYGIDYVVHSAGVAHDEIFDPTPYAEAMTRHFLRHSLSSSLPRKFKIAFEGITRRPRSTTSGCAPWCGPRAGEPCAASRSRREAAARERSARMRS